MQIIYEFFSFLQFFKSGFGEMMEKNVCISFSRWYSLFLYYSISNFTFSSWLKKNEICQVYDDDRNAEKKDPRIKQDSWKRT